MLKRIRDRIFIVVCCVYLLLVTITFVVGRLHLDAEGVSFIPSFLLTLPWSFILSSIHLPTMFFSALTAFYDLPLFMLSAALNIFTAGFLRHFLVVPAKIDSPIP